MQDCGYVDIVFLTIPLDQRMSVFTYMIILMSYVCRVDWAAGPGGSEPQGSGLILIPEQ